MNGGVVTLVVSGPVPGSARGDAESASALIRELHARTILHVTTRGGNDSDSLDPSDSERSAARAGPDDPDASIAATPAESARSGAVDVPLSVDVPPGEEGAAAARHKGLDAGSLAELVVTGLFSATTIAALAQVAVAFVQRGAARQITFRDGRRTLTITVPSEETEQLVAEWLGAPPVRHGAGSGAD